jgi:hypothetical protein
MNKMQHKNMHIQLETPWDPVTFCFRGNSEGLGFGWVLEREGSYDMAGWRKLIDSLREAVVALELGDKAERVGWLVEATPPAEGTLLFALSGGTLLFVMAADGRVSETNIRKASVEPLAQALEDLLLSIDAQT